jgi:hypothetical protein
MARSKKAEPTQLPLSDATESYLGYAYQGLFAMLVLMDAADDEAVSIETADDVALSGSLETLHQLKHSRTSTRALSIRDEGWWKTLRVWIEHYRVAPGRYVYVTTAPVLLGDPLEALSTDADRRALRAALVTEASKIEQARSTAQRRGARAPHQRKARGAAAFLTLGTAAQADFLSRITLHARFGTIADLPAKVAARLSSMVLPRVRPLVVERLIEWWDRRVLLGLIGTNDRMVQKAELQYHVATLVAQHRDVALPDDYGLIDPPETELEWVSMIVTQMRLVNAGRSRILRGLEAHWRAAKQRERWLNEDLSVRAQLNDFDVRLVRAWRDRHGPLRDDCVGRDDSFKIEKGRDLLDWSHTQAYIHLPPVRSGAPHDFLTQGTYQMLSQRRKVGWHPDYDSLLQASSKKARAR